MPINNTIYGEKGYRYRSRNSVEVLRVRNKLLAAINSATNKTKIELNLSTAKNLIEICNQCYHFEKAQEPL